MFEEALPGLKILVELYKYPSGKGQSPVYQ